MPGRYAEKTKVSVEKSQRELAETLKRYEATQTLTFHDDENDRHVVQCKMRGRLLRFMVQMPPRTVFYSDREWEQEERRRWRVLIMSVKAKFEEITDETTEFDEAFLSNIVLPNGKTVYETVAPQVDEAYETGQMPTMADAFQRALPPPNDTPRLKEVK